MIRLIVAIDRHGAIGRGGDLLYRIREDLRRFKAMTMGNVLVMGRRTFESLPNGALPGRRNIVLTGKADYSAPGIETAPDIGTALRMASEGPGDTFIIGGSTVYRAALPYADVLHLTVIDRETSEADTFFPVLDLDRYCVTRIVPGEGDYTFIDLERRRQ